MNGPCYNGGPNCGKLDCAWGCAGSVKFTVPTGSVPRVDRSPSGVLYADPIQQAVDDYLLMERKARAWDELRSKLEMDPLRGGVVGVLAMMDALVHPAQPSAPAKG